MTLPSHPALIAHPALPTARSVVALEPGAGEHVWFLDHLVTVKLRGAGAPWGVLEVALPAGARTPFHRHDDDDETLYVLEGELTLFLEGGRVVQGRPGCCLHLPRGIAHGFRTETAIRMLVLCQPEGFVEFTRDYGVPAPRAEVPPPALPDFPRLEALARKHHIELLGPLPEG
jgi:quercetin dioxygenase-like cupin family protein